jgi:hypothetical protein
MVRQEDEHYRIAIRGVLKAASGEVLTEDVIEELADEAERGYDLDKAKRIHMGPPHDADGGVSSRARMPVDSDLPSPTGSREVSLSDRAS